MVKWHVMINTGAEIEITEEVAQALIAAASTLENLIVEIYSPRVPFWKNRQAFYV